MNETANIHWGELQDWAEILFRLQDWLLHVGDDTIADYHQFTNGRQRFDDIVAEIGTIGVRIRRFAEQAQP